MGGTIAAAFSTSAPVTNTFLPCSVHGVGISVLLQNNHCKRCIWCCGGVGGLSVVA